MKDRRNEAPEPVVPAAPAPRARLADIARLAGVSSATADRVINHRPGVRTATMHRVLKVAAEMGYLPASDLMASLRPKPMQLVFLLPTGTNRYFRLLANYIDYAEEQLADLNVRCRYHFVEGFNPNVLAERLRHYGRRADGIAFMALERTIYARLHQLTVEQVKRDLLTAGLLTEGEYTAAMIALDRNFLAPTPILWSVVARRPAASREHEEVPR